MPPREKTIQKIVGSWVERARDDLALAEHLIATKVPFNRAIAFNSQQAAEKYLKALLARRQV